MKDRGKGTSKGGNMNHRRLTTAILLAILLAVALPAPGQADPHSARIEPLDRIELVETGLWERLLSWVGRGLDQLLGGYTAAEGASMGTHG